MTEETKHTPLPWRRLQNSNNWQLVQILPPYAEIAKLKFDSNKGKEEFETAFANAELILKAVNSQQSDLALIRQMREALTSSINFHRDIAKRESIACCRDRKESMIKQGNEALTLANVRLAQDGGVK